MALPIFAPAITKTRQAISQSSQKAILRLVPELETGKSVSTKSLAMLGTIIMVGALLVMFVITSLSTQDAFTLAKLQHQAQSLSDEREAVNRQIAYSSSPLALASKATHLGMKPNTQPRFIDISNPVSIAKNG